jgi:hypothetical protein
MLLALAHLHMAQFHAVMGQLLDKHALTADYAALLEDQQRQQRED